MKIKLVAYMILVFVLISGCSQKSNLKYNEMDVKEQITIADENSHFPEVNFNQKKKVTGGNITLMDEKYFGADNFDISINGALDELFDINFKNRNVNLLMKDIAEAIGLPVNIDHSAFFDKSGTPKFYRKDLQKASADEKESNKNIIDLETPVTINLKYKGTRKGFLDYLCFKADCGWWVEDESINISHLAKKTWNIPLLSGQQDISSQLSNSSSSGSSGGGGSQGTSITGSGGQSISSQINLNVFGSIQEAVQGMISDEGKLNLSESFGLLTVEDKTSNINTISNYIEKVVKKMSIQVAFNVHVLTVERTDTDNRGIKWDLVNKSLGDFGVGASINSIVSADADSLAVTVLDPADDWIGSSALIQSLSSQVDIVRRNKYGGITMNHTPLPIQVTRDAPFLNISSAPANSNGDFIQEYEVIKETIGISMSLLPVVLDNDEVLIHFNLTDSNLVDEKVFDFGDSGSSQVPVKDSRNFIQRAKLKSGQTLVLTGFSQDIDRYSTSSPIHKKAWIPFGSKNNQETKTDLMIIITPEIIESI